MSELKKPQIKHEIKPEIHELIGKGAFSSVYKGKAKKYKDGEMVNDNETIALKEIPKNLDDETWNNISNEIIISSHLSSDNIVRMLDKTEINNKNFIAYEYCNGGDLRKYMDYFKTFDEALIQEIMSQIVNGLSELFQQDVVHHDIKPENILLKLFYKEDTLSKDSEGKYQAIMNILNSKKNKNESKIEENIINDNNNNEYTQFQNLNNNNQNNKNNNIYPNNINNYLNNNMYNNTNLNNNLNNMYNNNFLVNNNNNYPNQNFPNNYNNNYNNNFMNQNNFYLNNDNMNNNYMNNNNFINNMNYGNNNNMNNNNNNINNNNNMNDNNWNNNINNNNFMNNNNNNSNNMNSMNNISNTNIKNDTNNFEEFKNIPIIQLKELDIIKILKNSTEYKLSDFGLSKLKNDIKKRNLCGSPLYMSPELFKTDSQISDIENRKVDIWALGILAYELFFGKRPFEAFSLDELSDMFDRGIYFIDLNLTKEKKISKEFFIFLNKCLQKDPKNRANILDLKKCDFLNLNIDFLEKMDSSQFETFLNGKVKINRKENKTIFHINISKDYSKELGLEKNDH
jgi:serine/threonine protein kinase